jgi:hypothetical protein
MMPSQQITEILIEQRRLELDRINPHTLAALQAKREHDGLRHAVASALVRLGTTLDGDAAVNTRPLVR